LKQQEDAVPEKPSPDTLTRDELGAYIALVTAGDLMQRAVSKQLAEHDLTTLQFAILANLLEAPDGLRMSDLAEELVISRSGLTYQLTQLEKVGLAERTTSDSDNRGVVARLTDAGRTRVQGAFPGHIALVRQNFLALLAPDEAAQLRTSLEGVVGRLRGH
jgi:DNA-binding MarR family transcriptional regulator